MTKAVTLEELLMARERRVLRRERMLCAYPGTAALCLLVNVPGPGKRLPEGDRVFEAGVKKLQEALSAAGVPLLHGEILRADTGSEARFAVPMDPMAAKALACELEASLPYGRLLDIDVPGPDGQPISRTALGLPLRGCMVCGKAGVDCASRRLHPLPEILDAFYRLAKTAEETT